MRDWDQERRTILVAFLCAFCFILFLSPDHPFSISPCTGLLHRGPLSLYDLHLGNQPDWRFSLNPTPNSQEKESG